MPVVDVDPDELRRLTGHDEKSNEELIADLFDLGIEYEGETDDGELQLEFAPDRLDRLSVEGIARSLRYQYGDDRGVYVPRTNDAEWVIEVEDVPAERPYVTGAVIRGLDLDDDQLDSIIQLQEKLHATMGRGRVKGAIGVHDLAMLKGRPASVDENADERAKSIIYTGIAGDEDRFVPLDADSEMTPADVLSDHQTGREYAPIVDEYESYPAIYDDVGLFSFPPVINGARTEVDTGTRDLFVEMTGTDQWTIDRMCAIMCYAFDARGGRIEDVRVEYPEGSAGAEDTGRDLIRPDLHTREKTVTHERIESVLGISLSGEEVLDLFERSGLDVAVDGEESDGPTYEVTVPAYRVDVLHPLDLVDDVGRAYGFNDLEPTYPDVSTVGGRHERSRLERAARETLCGLGFQDLLNFHMTREPVVYDRMYLDEGTDALGGESAVRITEPYSEEYTILRTWALPSIALVLENNTHRAYPQDLAEIGLVAHRDDDEPTGVAEARHVAAALAQTDASYEAAKAKLGALARTFDADLETPPTDHPSFVDGRCAEVVLDGAAAGVVGELHPAVLVEHDLEVPVAAFEFRLDALE